MFCKDTPTSELVRLRTHVLSLVSSPGPTEIQASNLLLVLDLVEAELCARCDKECLIPDSRPTICKHDLKLASERKTA